MAEMAEKSRLYARCYDRSGIGSKAKMRACKRLLLQNENIVCLIARHKNKLLPLPLLLPLLFPLSLSLSLPPLSLPHASPSFLPPRLLPPLSSSAVVFFPAKPLYITLSKTHHSVVFFKLINQGGSTVFQRWYFLLLHFVRRKKFGVVLYQPYHRKFIYLFIAF